MIESNKAAINSEANQIMFVVQTWPASDMRGSLTKTPCTIQAQDSAYCPIGRSIVPRVQQLS